MVTNIKLQLPKPKKENSIESVLRELAGKKSWTQISVAVAYASVAGVTKLCEIIHEKCPSASIRWILGLDDYITQPGAIELCQKTAKSITHVYSSEGTNSRFHPKIFLFEQESDELNSIIVIGSANLTYSALLKNCEAIAVLECSGAAENSQKGEIEILWSIGKEPTDQILNEYKKKFKQYRPTRKFALATEPKIHKAGRNKPILTSDEALVSPEKANVCWIEVGKNTAMGRELEFKAEQALFFGLSAVSKAAETKQFQVSDGSTVDMRIKFQSRNSMWRLQLKNDVPEVAKGLRPKVKGRLGRSPFVAVFTRLNNDEIFKLEFIRRNSPQVRTMIDKSKKLGAAGSTSSREYGWY